MSETFESQSQILLIASITEVGDVRVLFIVSTITTPAVWAALRTWHRTAEILILFSSSFSCSAPALLSLCSPFCRNFSKLWACFHPQRLSILSALPLTVVKIGDVFREAQWDVWCLVWAQPKGWAGLGCAKVLSAAGFTFTSGSGSLPNLHRGRLPTPP